MRSKSNYNSRWIWIINTMVCSFFLPSLVLTIVGSPLYWYYRDKKKKARQDTPDNQKLKQMFNTWGGRSKRTDEIKQQIIESLPGTNGKPISIKKSSSFTDIKSLTAKIKYSYRYSCRILLLLIVLLLSSSIAFSCC